jgi:hypothetical protein
MAVEVVDAQQLQLDGPGLGSGVRLVGARIQAEQRNEKCGRKRGRPGQEMTAVDASHGRHGMAALQGFCGRAM